MIDVDDVRHLVVAGHAAPWDGDQGRLQQQIGVDNACDLARRFLSAQIDVVLADFVTTHTAALYRRNLPELQIIRLRLPLREAHRRAQLRPVHLTEQEFESSTTSTPRAPSLPITRSTSLTSTLTDRQAAFRRCGVGRSADEAAQRTARWRRRKPTVGRSTRTRHLRRLVWSGGGENRVVGVEMGNESVHRAFAAVGRERFLPWADRAEVEADAPVVTHRDAQGRATSSASQPSLVVTMLDQLDLLPGLRVLEVGAGTGFNAAVIAELVGPSGSVVTIDIQPDVVAEARAALDRTGYGRVVTVVGEGVDGAAELAPFDRIIVTAGASDVPRAWFDQLEPGGRLVVPLRWRGQTQSIAFVRAGNHLESDSLYRCGFMPMVGQVGEHTAVVTEEVTLTFDTDQHLQVSELAQALLGPGRASWSGVHIGREEPIASLWLRLSAREPGTIRLAAAAAAVSSGRFSPAVPSHCPTLAAGDSLAYLAVRSNARTPNGAVELGAVAHGPRGGELAGRLVSEVQAWDHDRESRPTVQAWPSATAPLVSDHATVIPKTSVQLVLAY